ncbi:MAG TPA: glycogen synthase [Candidatus Polarisedimenticolaceae bacterium]|nr:glycogen synthase [Candidatus Polarisedimenticolaceae bacterium]
MAGLMRVVFMAREYPPEVYGGAGVHLEHLARAMARLARVEVKCFGERPADAAGGLRVVGYPYGDSIFADNPDPARHALAALETCLRFNGLPVEADVVHCHTWYSHFGGLLAKIVYGTPLVVTVHSLEPLRPWKRDKLGRGYDLSLWVERTTLELADAVIAVSAPERAQVLDRFEVRPDRVHVIPNGVDTDVYRKIDGKPALRRLGIDPDRPFVLFVGRLSRQKGIGHLLRAVRLLPPSIGLALVAASPDSNAIEREVEAAVDELRRERDNVSWIRRMLPRDETIALYSEAAVFCCPSVYEPFGIINLEAMACETPVVGTAVGGIRETVVPEQTGLLVGFEPRSADDPEPRDPQRLARELAAAIERAVTDETWRAEAGRRGRRRVVERYGWDRVAARVFDVYRRAVAGTGGGMR